jgi:hypothetical protein
MDGVIFLVLACMLKDIFYPQKKTLSLRLKNFAPILFLRKVLCKSSFSFEIINISEKL